MIYHAKSWSCNDIVVPKLWTGDTKPVCSLESAGYQVTSLKHKEEMNVIHATLKSNKRNKPDLRA